MADGYYGSRQGGIKNSRARLTEGQVRAIRKTEGSSSQVAAQFNISPRHVRQIKDGTAWSYLDD